MDEISLDAEFQKVLPEVERAGDAIEKALRSIKSLSQSVKRKETKATQFRTCKRFLRSLYAIDKPLQSCICQILEMQFTAYWTAKLSRQPDLNSYPVKQLAAKELNADLRHYGYLLRHPKSGLPCNLLAVSTSDQRGRYVLSDRLSKKRSCTSSTLMELMPIRLIEEPRRREAFLEQTGDDQ